MRRLVALAVVALTGAILPAGAAASSGATVPDFWSGAWPSFLMEGGQVTDPLGTLNWRPIRADEGASMVGNDFGGRVFEGCPTGAETLFFRGKYVTGGDLVACTTTGDGRTIVGRFNGNEQLRSGSFTVSIVQEGPARVFMGKYFEDEGLVTDWCGSLTPGSQPPTFDPGVVDIVSPAVTAVPSAGRAGRPVTLRFRVSEPAAVKVLVRGAGRTVATLTTRAATAGRGAVAWRAPKALRGAKLSFLVVATDAAGNVSARAGAALRLT
jgi:hypothetical protein